jgi:hypothetical protein
VQKATNLLQPESPNQALALFEEILSPPLFQCGAVEQEIMRLKLANFKPALTSTYQGVNKERII